ncbi:hypothetical protein [Vibrio mexicanus]|uniref:hypothetical protein n=1 Tax=Vibrio mexicanus TaxID=1004326 RepID=UPI00063BFF76|nr:hypothetical protein [Vibrio mexicanus]
MTKTNDNQGRQSTRTLALDTITEQYPLVIDQRNRALIQNGAGSSYAMEVQSEDFSKWVRRFIHKNLGNLISSQNLKDLTESLAALAHISENTTHSSWRIYKTDSQVCIDLGDGKIVHITPEGWHITTEVQGVCFLHSKQKLPLPMPTAHPDMEILRPYLNLGSDDQWCLLLTCIVGMFMDLPSKPIITFTGPEGCAKSTHSSLIQKLIDPNPVTRQLPPSTLDELVMASMNTSVFLVDNVSSLSSKIMDACCALSTGLDIRKRQLYSDFTTVTHTVDTTMIINGINPEFVKQSDLASRVVSFELPVIGAENRTAESDYWASFEADKPKILGALYSLISKVLKVYKEVEFTPVSRLSDFCKVGNALEKVLEWPQGTFDSAMSDMHRKLKLISLDSDVLGRAVLALMKKQESWEGKPTALLEKLSVYVSTQEKKSASWPKTPISLGHKLRALEPALNSQGIIMTTGKSNSRYRRLERKANT